MTEPKNEIPIVTSLVAEALGEPGQRTFRFLVDGEGSSAILWLEKEQLFQLALAIQQLLAGTSEEDAPEPVAEGPSGTVPINLDFKVGRLALGHDGKTGLFMIDAYDVEDEDEDTATVRVWAGKDVVKEFSDEAMRVCASGRPLCPLCGGPMDPDGHACARVNGHVKTDRL